MRAQRDDIKEPPPTQLEQLAKVKGSKDTRRRIIGTRGLEVQTDNQRKPQEFFSSRKDFKNVESGEVISKNDVKPKPKPKKFETDRIKC